MEEPTVLLPGLISTIMDTAKSSEIIEVYRSYYMK